MDCLKADWPWPNDLIFLLVVLSFFICTMCVMIEPVSCGVMSIAEISQCLAHSKSSNKHHPGM